MEIFDWDILEELLEHDIDPKNPASKHDGRLIQLRHSCVGYMAKTWMKDEISQYEFPEGLEKSIVSNFTNIFVIDYFRI